MPQPYHTELFVSVYGQIVACRAEARACRAEARVAEPLQAKAKENHVLVSSAESTRG
jgi:hypothetical protein